MGNLILDCTCLSAELVADAIQMWKESSDQFSIRTLARIEIKLLKKHKLKYFAQAQHGSFLRFVLESDLAKVNRTIYLFTYCE